MSSISIKPTRAGSFPGGILPEEHKPADSIVPIRHPALPPRLVIPVSQPAYADPELLVGKGDRVLKGQLIARGSGSPGLACHASSSGKVTDISAKPVPNSSGLPELCITIDTDGRDESQKQQALANFRELDRNRLISRIADAGISGLGGAGFPAYAKLGFADIIDTLIINACECEPFISSDDALMREHAPEINTGIQILRHILQPRQCLLGIEDNKLQALAALNQALDRETVAVRVIPARYPSGAEKQLIRILTGMEVPAGTLPPDSGVLCLNVATAFAIYQAVCLGIPLISRITTLTGAALKHSCNMEVRIGTPIAFLLNECGLDQERLSRLIMGGSLMGITLSGQNLPIIKISNCIIATTEDELPTPPPARACIRCGMCTDACPVSLLPQQLYWFARGREHEKAQQHNLFDCIECGACAYVCPSHIPLVQYYRAAKAEIREEQDRHRRGDHSRERFEFHQSRMEKEQAKQEQRRRERAELARNNAADGQSAEAAIQAALERVRAKKTAQDPGDPQT